MKYRAIVLGCGMIRSTMAKDLAQDSDVEVVIADISEQNLQKLKTHPHINTIRTDLGDPSDVRNTVNNFDLVLGALQSRIGFQTLQTIIETGKSYCDISFMSEDAKELNDLTKKQNVTAIVDCGVAPGLSNMMVGYVHSQLDETDRTEIYVGGLPKARDWPYQYKAPFAPADVLEEYTRPARIVENGRVVTRTALSEPELMELPHAGTLEAFLTDGLRSLIHTLDIPNMVEKTLRYPGHCELMRILRETGLFDKTKIEVAGVRVRPLDVTSKLLFPRWTYEPGEEDFTVLRVRVEGTKEGQKVRYTYDLYDEYDRETQTSSMSRTTAFPATIVGRMLINGVLKEPGVFTPEQLAARPDIFDHMVKELRAKGVHLSVDVQTGPS